VEVVGGVRVLAGPLGEDFRHVHPWDEIAGEGVQEAFFWEVDLCDTEDVVYV